MEASPWVRGRQGLGGVAATKLVKAVVGKAQQRQGPGKGQAKPAPAADPLDEYPMQELKEFNGKKPQATFAAVSSLLSLVSLLIKDVEVLCMADPVDEYPGSGWECSNLDGRGQLQVGLRRADAVRGSGPREIKGIS